MNQLNSLGLNSLGVINAGVSSVVNYESVVTALAPVLWFDFTESSGNLTNRGSAGSSGNMTAAGSLTYSQTGERGPNQAVDFDGNDSRFSASNSSAFQISNKSTFTFMALVDVDTDGQNNLGTFIGKGSNFFYATEVSAGVNARVIVLTDHATTDANTQTSDTFNLNEFTLITYVYNENSDNRGKVYLNDSEAALSVDIAGVGGLVDDSAMDFIIGDIRFLNRNFDGFMDEILFFDKALSSSEVASVANSLGL